MFCTLDSCCGRTVANMLCFVFGASVSSCHGCHRSVRFPDMFSVSKDNHVSEAPFRQKRQEVREFDPRWRRRAVCASNENTIIGWRVRESRSGACCMLRSAPPRTRIVSDDAMTCSDVSAQRLKIFKTKREAPINRRRAK